MIKTISALWVLAIPAYKIVFSTYHYLTAKYYLFIYEKYINGCFEQQKQEKSQDEDRNKEYRGNSKNLSKILAHKNRMIKLLKQANVDDHQIPYMQPIGLGKCVSNVMSIYMNLEKTITIDIPGQGSAFIPHEIYVSLWQAKGIYKLQIYDAINPIYWAVRILPKLDTYYCHVGQ